ncbi:glycosyltransferase family A protein [uncultured Roseobacter sp.]|uniref:glycosyltransferase family 2 protein n=1 Tax=uncultured Roseobacter sp. TaxID=114847 RepID=UPI0026345796|nr:glycosyltransferase family A protein [uncultured Roseobacter sp.]
MRLSDNRPVEDISIITAVYNHEGTISDTLDSILMQGTSCSFHIYCMDDSSTDRSAEFLEAYRVRHPDKITVFTSAQNQGSGKKCFCITGPRPTGRIGVYLRETTIGHGRTNWKNR